MIFSHPLTLAGRYLTYVAMVVLLGMMLVEYFTQKEWWRADKARFRAFLTLTAITVLGVSWITIDFLGDIGVLLPLHAYWVLLGLTTTALAYINLLAWRGAIRLPVFTVLAAVTFGAFALGFERSGYPSDSAWPRFVDFVVSTIGVIFYYLLVIRILMLNDSQSAGRRRQRVAKASLSGKSLRYSLIIGVFAFSALTVYFGVRAFTKPQTAREAPIPPQSVTVRLKWIPQAQFAGMYVADKKGYYQEENLQVSLLPFDYQHYPIDDVVKGFGTFGIASADEVLIARSQGLPVVALAVIHQKSPLVMYTLEDSGIEHPRDMRGRRVGIQVGSQSETVASLFTEAGGLLADDFTSAPIYSFNGTPLEDGEVDILSGYAFNEPLQLEKRGFKVRVLNIENYGYHLYGDVIFTTENVIRDNPELARSFVKATLRGWQSALSNPDEAVRDTLLFDDGRHTDMTYDFQRRFFDAQIPYLAPSTDGEVGRMEPEVWQEMYSMLSVRGLLKREFNVRDAFTTRFLP